MNLSKNWKDYELLDLSDGMKLERYKDILLARPDPQVIWKNEKKSDLWEKCDAIYYRNSKGGGYWEYKKNIPSSWEISYKDLTFNIKTMGFKHTGVFPEQAFNWDYMIDKIKSFKRKINVLNLFAYTGGASLACLSAGASVVHVDSSKGVIEQAKENVKSSNLDENSIRYILDDVIKFVKREIRRGNKYDAIVMDPPSFGRGANKEVWNIEKDLFDLVKLCNELLSEDPIFFIINSYTTGLSSKVLSNILKLTISKNGLISSGEVGIPVKDSDLILPCGIFARWEK